MNDTDVFYLTFMVDTSDEATSMAAYFRGHGVDAAGETNEVTVPITDLSRIPQIQQLRAGWKLFWRHSDAELYGLPVFHKTGCGCCADSSVMP